MRHRVKRHGVDSYPCLSCSYWQSSLGSLIFLSFLLCLVRFPPFGIRKQHTETRRHATRRDTTRHQSRRAADHTHALSCAHGVCTHIRPCACACRRLSLLLLFVCCCLVLIRFDPIESDSKGGNRADATTNHDNNNNNKEDKKQGQKERIRQMHQLGGEGGGHTPGTDLQNRPE